MFGSLSLFPLLHLSGMKFSNSGKCWDILPITITGSWSHSQTNEHFESSQLDAEPVSFPDQCPYLGLREQDRRAQR